MGAIPRHTDSNPDYLYISYKYSVMYNCLAILIDYKLLLIGQNLKTRCAAT